MKLKTITFTSILELNAQGLNAEKEKSSIIRRNERENEPVLYHIFVTSNNHNSSPRQEYGTADLQCQNFVRSRLLFGTLHFSLFLSVRSTNHFAHLSKLIPLPHLSVKESIFPSRATKQRLVLIQESNLRHKSF